eukprot:1149428-Pelagomonas_calceolata.AAC.2
MMGHKSAKCQCTFLAHELRKGREGKDKKRIAKLHPPTGAALPKQKGACNQTSPIQGARATYKKSSVTDFWHSEANIATP